MSSFNKNYLEVSLREFHSERRRQNSESYSKKSVQNLFRKKIVVYLLSILILGS